MYVPCPGWRQIVERLHQKLGVARASQPAELGGEFEIEDMKERFGRLVVRLAGRGTPEMDSAIQEAAEDSAKTCSVCGAPGSLAERGPTGWWSVRCGQHENWSRLDGIP
jgi:hypothetical protein